MCYINCRYLLTYLWSNFWLWGNTI